MDSRLQSFTLESHRAGLNIPVSLEVFCFCFKSYLMLSYETDTVTIFKLRDPEDQVYPAPSPLTVSMWVKEEHRLCPYSFFWLSASRTFVGIPIRVYMVPVYLPVKLPEGRIGSLFIFSYLQFSFLHLSDVLDFSSWSLGNCPPCFPEQTAAECLLLRRLSVGSQGKVHGLLELQFHCLFLSPHLGDLESGIMLSH